MNDNQYNQANLNNNIVGNNNQNINQANLNNNLMDTNQVNTNNNLMDTNQVNTNTFNNNLNQNQNINTTMNNNNSSMKNILSNKKYLFLLVAIIFIVGFLITTVKINNQRNALLMGVEDVFTITGKGTTVTGVIAKGKVKVGDTIQVIGLDNSIKTTKVTGIEKFREVLESAEKGDNVGIILGDLTRNDVERGNVIATPNSIKQSKKIKAKVSMLATTKLASSLYNRKSANIVFSTQTEIFGTITMPDNIKSINPGETQNVTINFNSSVPLEKDLTFSIRENGIEVATGTILKIY